MTQNKKIFIKLYDYLKLMGWEVPKIKPIHTPILCPECKGVASTIPFAFKIRCTGCDKRYTILDCVRLLEKDKENYTDNQIFTYLAGIFKIEYFPEEDIAKLFEFYKKNNFDLVPTRANGKAPVEKEWTVRNHTEILEWEDWIKTNNNMGVKTGRISNVTVLDFDDGVSDEIKPLLGNTLIQETNRGFHYFYKYEEDLPKTRVDKFTIDIENDGGQVIVAPSIIDGKRRTMELKDIEKMSPELKKLLQSNLKAYKPKTVDEKLQIDIKSENFKINPDDFKLKSEGLEGCCNSSFIRLGGILRKELNAHETEFVLKIFNKHLLEKPMDNNAIEALCRSVDKYIDVDEKDLAGKIIKYLRMVEEATSRDLKEIVGETKERVDSALSYLVKEGYILKVGKGRGVYYQILKHANWKDTFPLEMNNLGFDIPFFQRSARLCWGDMVLLGSRAKWGKTTISINFLKSFVEQGIKPYYICLETGSRFIETAKMLGLIEGNFYWDFQSDPTKIELEPNAVTILDWLMIEDKSQTDNIMKHFIEQLYKTNGFLIVFQQLKVDGTWFAPNMINQFPSLSARYLYDDDKDGSTGRWEIDVIREPLIDTKTAQIPCVYDHTTRTLEEIKDFEDFKGNKKKGDKDA